MEFGITIKNLVIIGAIVGVAFLSQVPFFATTAKNYVYSPNVGGWIHDNIVARVSQAAGGGASAVAGGTGLAAAQIETQKNNVLQNSVNGTKKFIAEKILNILGVTPSDLAGCRAK